MKNDRDVACRGRLFPGLSIIVLTLMCLLVQPARASALIVKVGVYENAPKIFISESGKPAGIFIDVIEHIAEIENWDLRYVPGTWTEGLDRLSQGNIDLMPDVAYTADRARIYAFHSEPVLSSWFQVYARKEGGIRSILDLSGKRIAVLERSVQQEAFARLADGFGLDATLISVPDYKTIFEIVAKGEADAAITNRFYGSMHARQHGLEDTTVVFNPSTLFFAASKTAPQTLLDTIDYRLMSLKKDPESIYYGSLKRWTAERVRFQLPSWAQTLGWIAGVILLVSLAESFFLKRQVNARTRELRQINREMEQRIVERTSELAEAMERAQAADRIKSAFLATMSHELRTPLNSIIGFSGIMLQGLAGALNPEQHKQMSMVQGSARHLLALINDVLDISKIEAGQLMLAIASFDLRAAIEKTVKLVSPLTEKKGLELTLEMSADISSATTDQRRLEQVLLNLFNNAVKFTEKGRVSVRAYRIDDLQLTAGDLKKDEIQSPITKRQSKIVISVADTGIGMLPEHLQSLFQPFHQIDNGLTRKYEGTGLGLSICKKLVEMMDGVITVKSEYGKGSEFTVLLPNR